MRYSATERLGVIEADRIVTKHLGWIFREQPIVDVGIDAIIEETENGEPSGKFLAVQIKSGENNFHFKENYLTYYVSNIHYHYWLNLNIPIIMIVYLPKTDACYWQVINKRTLKRTNKRWKINIPKENSFKKSKQKISKLLVEIKTKNIFSKIYQYDFDADFSEEFNLLSESILHAHHMKTMMENFDNKLREFDKENRNLMEKGYTSRDPQLKGNVKLQSRYLTTMSHRFVNEANIFSEVFPEEVFLLEQLLYSLYYKKIIIPEDFKVQIRLMETRLKSSSSNINGLVDVSKGITKNTITAYPTMKAAKASLVEAFEILSYEYDVASIFARKLGVVVD